MSRETTGSIDIEATAEEVMEVITDFEAYPEWAGVEAAEVLERDEDGRPTAVAFRVSQMGLAAAYTLEYAYQPDHGGVAWTIKDGILFDAQALLREAEWYIEQEKARMRGRGVTSGSAQPER